MNMSEDMRTNASGTFGREKRRLLLGLGVLGLSALGFSSIATGAYFTDTASVTGTAFTTGTVKIGATPATSALRMANLAPGDVVTAPITVSNRGTLAQRYAVLSTTRENVLSAQLQLTVKSGVTTCTTAGFRATGVSIYGPGVLGSTGGTKVIGSSASGAQRGDRTLAAGSSEVLCVQVSLPATTGNAFQAKSTTATLTFNAEQTVNNP